MDTERIKVKVTESGQEIEVVVLSKRAGAIEVVIGEGVHSVRCTLTPTRSGAAYVGSIRGRELVLSGHRDPEAGEDRVYQQLEIEHGPFRRVVALGADVDSDAADAKYEDGILTVELPLTRPSRPTTVPIRGTEK